MIFKKNYLTTKKEFIKRVAITFISIFISTTIVFYLWNLIFRGNGSFDWRLPIVLATSISPAHFISID